MIEMFLPLAVVCSPVSPQDCAIVSGPLFQTEQQCEQNLSSEGLNYILTQYGSDVHLAHIGCQIVMIEGEPT